MPRRNTRRRTRAFGGSTQTLIELLDNLVKKSETLPPPRGESIQRLREAYRAGTLVLVLGAGVSMDYGLLSWNRLLQKLLIATFKDNPAQNLETSSVLAGLFNQVFRPTPLIAARYLNNFYRDTAPSDPLAFLNAVRAALYSGFDEKKQTELLKQIRQLCMAVGKSPNLQAIITYNFDDLVEVDLEKSGAEMRFRSIYAPGVHANDDELAIYHVHGYLPRKIDLTELNKVVLSEDYYHEQYRNVYDWSNLVQINTFSQANCLFIGTSLTDPNQRRLLDIAKALRGDDAIHHYCIRRRYKAHAVKAELDRVLKADPDLFGEKVAANMRIDPAGPDLIRVMENYEEKDAESFGVGTIWVNEHPEAATVLRDIRVPQRAGGRPR